MACEAPCDFGCVIWELYLFNCVDMDTCRSPVKQCSNFSCGAGVPGLLDADHADVGYRDETFVHHVLQYRSEALHIVRRVYDLNHDGKIVPQNVRAVDLGRPTVALQSAKDRRARDLQLAALLNHGFMQRLALIAIPLREMEPEKFTWRCLHRLSP